MAQTDQSTRIPKLFAKGRAKSRLIREINEIIAEDEEYFTPGKGIHAIRDHNFERQDGPGRN